MKMHTHSDTQRALRGLGLYYGKIDGLVGEETKTAIRRFQTMNPPLEVDGIAGEKTLEALFPQEFGDRDGEGYGVLNNHKMDLQLPTYDAIKSFYGDVGQPGGRVKMPYPLKLAWDKKTTIESFVAHKKITSRFEKIFTDTLSEYGEERIDELGLNLFGGCFNVRKMRGGTRHSTHSWGVACDLNPAANQLKWNHKQSVFARQEYRPFWDIVYKYGGVSLGLERDYDWMHFQFVRV